MVPVEFYTDPRTGQAMCKVIGEPIIREITEKDTEIIAYILGESEAFYPEQYAAVSKEYAASAPNPRYYDFLRARRIINCCFGENDRQPDIDEFAHHNFEQVKCPRIAECKHYKIICNPRFDSRMSGRESEVMQMYFLHVPTELIAERLFLSIHTVNNHRKNALRRLKLRSMDEFIDYAHRHKIFDTDAP